MSRQPKSYLRYGSFVLLSKLEESTLGEIWRAAPIEGKSIGSAIALFRFTGGDQAALRRSAEQAAGSLRTVEGSTVVKGQTYHLVGKSPIITWDYVGGRSLFHMFQVANGGPELPANPFPIDQSLAIAEKLSLSLETTGHMKHGGQRLHHGLLIPQMVWVSEDGEVRTLGHQLTRGLLASLNRAQVQKQFGGYVAPELRRNGGSTDPSEVWSVGANLYAMLTGQTLPPPTDQAAIDLILSEAILATDEPIPDPVREVMAKSLTIDPARRFENPGSLREAISALTHGGEYAPTTFNLAFYIHNLLREEIEAEALEREAEKGIDPSLVPLMTGLGADVEDERTTVEPAAPTAAPFAAQTTTVPEEPRKKGRRRLPLVAAIIAILLIGGAAAGYWFTLGPGGTREPETSIADAGASAINDTVPAPRQPVRFEPLVAVTDTGEDGLIVDPTMPEQSSISDDDLRQKMIQEEIDRRLEAEILKLQSDYDRRLREERDRSRPREEPRQTQTPVPATPVQSQPTTRPSAAEELDRQKLEQAPQPAAPVAQTQPPPAATDTSTTEARSQTPPSLPQPAVVEPSSVKEGDLVEITEVDRQPTIIKRASPQYPRLAARQKVEATVLVTALVSETGKVIDVKILRGDRRKLGFDEAAVDAIRKSVFQPAMKDGKKVKTWMPVPIYFKAD